MPDIAATTKFVRTTRLRVVHDLLDTNATRATTVVGLGAQPAAATAALALGPCRPPRDPHRTASAELESPSGSGSAHVIKQVSSATSSKGSLNPGGWHLHGHVNHAHGSAWHLQCTQSRREATNCDRECSPETGGASSSDAAMVCRMNTHPVHGCYEHVFEFGHSITP